MKVLVESSIFLILKEQLLLTSIFLESKSVVLLECKLKVTHDYIATVWVARDP